MYPRSITTRLPRLCIPLAIVLWLGAPNLAMARETITWLLRDVVPLTISYGPAKGQGAIDRTLPLLQAALPEYDHIVLRVNRARALQMLEEPGLNCDPTLLWTAERARNILYSVPSMNTSSNGLIVRRQDQALIAPFISAGEVDLRALLDSGVTQVGKVAERSYGVVIDEILSQKPSQLLHHHGNDAVGSLLRMENLGRIRAMLGYLPEARYHALEQGIDPEQLRYLPIKGVARYQYIYVGCSNSLASQQVLGKINVALRALREGTLVDFYAAWLDPTTRQQYLQDAPGFFDGPSAPTVTRRY